MFWGMSSQLLKSSDGRRSASSTAIELLPFNTGFSHWTSLGFNLGAACAAIAGATHGHKTAPPRFGTHALSAIPHSMGRVRRSGSGGAFALLIGNSCRLLEYLHKHFSCQLAGLGVLIRRMIRGQ